jgi:hypothetical protein
VAANRSAGSGLGCLFVIAVVVAGAIYSRSHQSNAPPYDPNKPESIVGIITQDNAYPIADFRNGSLSLIYDIDPWMLTASTGKSVFLNQARQFFPQAFESPDVRFACIQGNAAFSDIRGNQSRGKALELCMSRKNASSVNWQQVDPSSLFRIADRVFVHSGFEK